MDHLFITWLWRDPYFFFGAVFFVVFSICCHEFMHAWIALKEGDSTAADEGYLTLNPLKQMGVFSLILLALLGLAWGQVPVDPDNFRRRRSEVRVALAGPLTNLALAFVFVLVCAFLLWGGCENERALQMIFYGGILNLVLFMLNMLPVPGFDGFVAVRHFFPNFLNFRSEAGTIVTVVLILLLFSCIRFLFSLAHFAGEALLRFLMEVLP